MRLVGADPDSKIYGQEAQPGKSNYLIGSDPKSWNRNVPHYGQVRYSEVYPGVDLIYHGNQRLLEYDFAVAPKWGARADSMDDDAPQDRGWITPVCFEHEGRYGCRWWIRRRPPS